MLTISDAEAPSAGVALRRRSALGIDPVAFTRGLIVAGYAAVLVGVARGFDHHGLRLRSVFGVLGVVGVALLVAAIALSWFRAVAEQRSVADILRDVAAPILTRTSSAVWFGVGVAIALPAIGLHGPVLTDADSGRIIANVAYMRRHGPGLLRQTQDVIGPNLIYWVTSVFGGANLARWVPVVGFLALAGTISALGRRISGSSLVAIGATLALVASPIILLQTSLLALYSFASMFAVLAAYFVWVAGDREEINTRFAMLGALCLVLGAEAHAVGQIFFVVPALLLILGPPRRRVRVALITYGTAALLLIPRLLIDVSVGGIHHLRSNYDTYTIDKGYLDLINEKFYHHPVGSSAAVYGHRLFDVFLSTFSWPGAIVGVFALVGLIVMPRRVQLLALAFVAIYIGSMLFAKPAPYPRYFLPLLPMFVMLAGFGLRAAWTRLQKSHPQVPVVYTLVITLVAGVCLFRQIHAMHIRDYRVENSPLPLADRMMAHDDKGVIGVRSPQLSYVNVNAQVWGSLFLSEKDYVTYLTWPSDAAVLKMFKRHDIGWIFIQSARPQEVAYPESWLLPTYGKHPTFIQRLDASPRFCPMLLAQGDELWKVGSCPKRDPRWTTGTFVPAVPTPAALGVAVPAPAATG